MLKLTLWLLQGVFSMKKLLALGALALAVPAQAAVVVTFTPGVSALPVGASIFEDFEDEAVGASLGTNAAVFAGTGPTAARPAFGSTGNFGAVLGVPNDGEYIVNFAASSIFSFVLGSLDTYNTLELLLSDGSSEVFNGAGITQGLLANGNQVNPNTNGRVTYSVVGGGPFIVGAEFRSTENSFEFDNLAIAAIPEPSTWLMMLMGFAAVSFTMRRKQNVRVSFA